MHTFADAGRGTLWARLNASLRAELTTIRESGSEPGRFAGLVLAGQDVESSLDRLIATGIPSALESDHQGSALEARLPEVVNTFALSDAEVSILLAATAPDLDLRYERVYAYIQDDVTRRRPTVDLLLRLLGRGAKAPGGARSLFHPDANLFRFGLLRLAPDSDLQPLLATAVLPDERVVAHLLGSDQVDPLLHGIAWRDEAPGPRPAQEHPPWRLAILTGAPGSGKARTATELCRSQGLDLLVADCGRLLRSELPPETAITAVFREASLHRDAVYWRGADRLWDDGGRASALRHQLLDLSQRWQIPQLLGGPASWDTPASVALLSPARISLERPTAQERLSAWTAALQAQALLTPEIEAGLPALASAFRLTPGKITDALAAARGARRSRAGLGADGVSIEDLYEGSRVVSNRRLGELAQELRPRGGWADIVLPADTLNQLKELCASVRNRGAVLEDWGFGARLMTGTGVTALFAGPPGTGKTFAASIVAHELRLPLYRIELAGIVSKWIGETEKNLDRVFAAAEDSNSILLFDEADALFGKRSEVRDSHDRYANLEISYLLQKMERYDGVAILATNMRQQLDDAFQRRLSYLAFFPLPEEAERLRIWQSIWPQATPLGEDLDLERVARVKLTGGNIRNIALAAAYLAAEEATAVGFSHVVRGLQREYQKLGKFVEIDSLEAEIRAFVRLGDRA